MMCQSPLLVRYRNNKSDGAAEARLHMNCRLDRMVAVYVASPVKRFLWRGDLAIPVLMYHSISCDDERTVPPYYRTTTTPDIFSAHIKYLHSNGYETCGLTEAVGNLCNKTQFDRKWVVITFDDGYKDFYTQAFPILSRYGYTATVFLPTAYIGADTRYFKGRCCLTWSEIRELRSHGISFGSHTVTHPRLRDLTRPDIHRELIDSKLVIEQKLGQEVKSFAYPFAFPEADAEFIGMLCDTLSVAGYQNGVCTSVGRANPNSKPLFIQRLPINSCDDQLLFEAKLLGGYDWIHSVQFASKYIRTTLSGLAGDAHDVRKADT